MNTLDETFARHFAQVWVDAWNAHDLDRVLAHYEDDFVFQSPMIAVFTGEPSGRLQGKAAVRAYAEETGAKLGQVAQPLRAALTGRGTSPGIFDVLEVLGRDESLSRLRDQAVA